MTPEQHKEIMTALQVQQDDILLIKTKLVGNKTLEIKGMSEMVEDHNKYIQGDKIFKAKVAGGLFLAVPLFGMFVEWVRKHWPF